MSMEAKGILTIDLAAARAWGTGGGWQRNVPRPDASRRMVAPAGAGGMIALIQKR